MDSGQYFSSLERTSKLNQFKKVPLSYSGSKTTRLNDRSIEIYKHGVLNVCKNIPTTGISKEFIYLAFFRFSPL